MLYRNVRVSAVGALSVNVRVHPPDMPVMDWLLTPPTRTRSAPPVNPPLETRDPLAYPDWVAPRKRLSAYVKLSELVLKLAENTGPGGGGGGGAVTVRLTVTSVDESAPSLAAYEKASGPEYPGDGR